MDAEYKSLHTTSYISYSSENVSSRVCGKTGKKETKAK